MCDCNVPIWYKFDHFSPQRLAHQRGRPCHFLVVALTGATLKEQKRLVFSLPRWEPDIPKEHTHREDCPSVSQLPAKTRSALSYAARVCEPELARASVNDHSNVGQLPHFQSAHVCTHTLSNIMCAHMKSATAVSGNHDQRLGPSTAIPPWRGFASAVCQSVFSRAHPPYPHFPVLTLAHRKQCKARKHGSHPGCAAAQLPPCCIYRFCWHTAAGSQ